MCWDNEKLLDKFMDSHEDVLRSAGEPESFGHESCGAVPLACDICLDGYEPTDRFELRCRHPFCKSCWTFYVTDKIRGEGQLDVRCMREDCTTVVDETAVANLVDEPTLLRLVSPTLSFTILTTEPEVIESSCEIPMWPLTRTFVFARIRLATKRYHHHLLVCGPNLHLKTLFRQ